jgi:hypothetical protein
VRASPLRTDTRRELERLQKLATAAHGRGDFVTEATCRLRWADLYRATGSPSSPAPEVKLTELQAKRYGTETHVPLWRVRQRFSPLVAIVKVEEIRFKTERGHNSCYFVEHLSCGHTHDVFEGLDYSMRSKRRRCRVCGDAALIASGYAGDIAEPLVDIMSTATASHSLSLAPGASSTVTMTLLPAKADTPKTNLVEMPKAHQAKPGPRSARSKPTESAAAEQQSG